MHATELAEITQELGGKGQFETAAFKRLRFSTKNYP